MSPMPPGQHTAHPHTTGAHPVVPGPVSGGYGQPTGAFPTGSFPQAGSFPQGGPSPQVSGPPPTTGPPFQSSGPPQYGQPSQQPTKPPRRGGRLGVVAFVLVILLIAVVGVQFYQLDRLDNRLASSDRAAATEKEASDARIKGLETRAKELEQRTGNTLDAAAVAADVTPSVFRVVAGRASGTTFAVGKESASGTDLLTNFHVVEEMYEAGGRDVSVERRSQRFTAKIVRVDKTADLALLHTEEKFARLAVETNVKPGQPVVVIGAPLGLEDSVTAGVVSALRNTAEGPVVQFDAPINPGNSGGPVINAQRKVVGVATAKAAEAEGIGLAVPIDVACKSFDIC
jgi:S1-C subfamily serine protease